MSSQSFALPRSVSVDASIEPQFAEFERPVRSFVVHNAKPTSIETMFCGNMMTVPACDVIRADKTAYDADGDPIPGTYVIADVWSWVESFGDYVLTFDAERAVRHVLGIPKVGPRDPNAKSRPAPIQLTSEFAIRGLSLLPMNAPKSMWRAVADAGEKRAFLAAVGVARVTVRAYQVAWATAKREGVEGTPAGPDYEYALGLLKRYKSMVGEEQETRMQPHREEAELANMEEDLLIEAEIKAIAMSVAEKVSAATGRSKQEQFEELLKDPSVRKLAQKKYRFRKKGYMDLGPDANVSADAAGISGDGDGDESDSEE